MNDAVLTDFDARLTQLEEWRKEIEARAPAPKKKKRWRHIDPKFRRILLQSMKEKGLNASDLAALMFGRRITPDGKNAAIGKDRISVWLAGKNYPSPEHMALLAQYVDVV